MSHVVQQYYDRDAEREWLRLESPYRRLELATTMHLVNRYFPRSGNIADIGGGPGRYTAELLRNGYRVTLVDLSPQAIALAQRKLGEMALHPEQTLCTDARDLSALAGGSFDGALHLGPLYHIIDPSGRRKALEELRRVLRPGSPAVVAFLNPWGILRAGLAEFPENFARGDLVRALLRDWVQAGEQEAFTEAAFLTPPRALEELRSAGFHVLSYAGAEGFAAGMQDELKRMAVDNPPAHANVLQLAAETCELPQYRDCTEHLHAVVQA
ncbi:MAG: class I SAM-dependent methyltransferase [Candidatus Bipolaricaulota bacterium]